MFILITRYLLLSIIFSFAVSQDDRESFLVSGNVYLEDALLSGGSHAGVTITLSNLLHDPPLAVASGESDESGTYFIRMTSGEFNSIQKVVLLK